MGWFHEAADSFFNYRKQKRKRKGFVIGFIERIFLEESFGYGVKPWILLRSFLFLWIIPSFIYLRFIHFKNAFPLPSWWFSKKRRTIRPRRFFWKFFRSRFSWALIYSIDTLISGISFEPLKTLTLYNFDPQKTICIKRIQQVIGWYLLVLFLILFSKIWIR